MLNSPENTNSNVLMGMLDKLDNNGDNNNVPIIYHDDTIDFYSSQDGAEFKNTFYICKDISDDINQILFEDSHGKGVFLLATKDWKGLLLPVNSTDLYSDELCLIQEKEVWVFSFNDERFPVIKNSNGVVPGTGALPK